MSSLKKSFEMYEPGKISKKKEGISERIKEFFKEDSKKIVNDSKSDNKDIYDLTSKAAKLFIPKDMDPILKDFVEAGTAYLLDDILKKYKT